MANVSRLPFEDNDSVRVIAPLRCHAWRRQRAIIQTYVIMIAATLNTISYSMVLAHFSRGNEIGTLRVRLHIPMDATWTRMAPAIAIAAGDCFSFAHGHFSWGGVLQQQSGPRGFII